MTITGGVWKGSVGGVDGLRGETGTMELKKKGGRSMGGCGSSRRKRPKQPQHKARLAKCPGRLKQGAGAAHPFTVLLFVRDIGWSTFSWSVGAWIHIGVFMV